MLTRLPGIGVTFHEVSMLFGRCYTVQFDRALKEGEHYHVRIHTSVASQVARWENTLLFF